MIGRTWANKNKNKIIFIIVNHDAWQSLLIGYINDCINLNIIENKQALVETEAIVNVRTVIKLSSWKSHGTQIILHYLNKNEKKYQMIWSSSSPNATFFV